jgi:chemotaxis protein methyltransferase CheR
MPVEMALKFFAHYIQRELGIVYAEHNYFQLQNRLEEIAKALGIASIEALHREASTGIHGAMKQLLLDLATNNETSFFRDPRVFAALDTILTKGLDSNLWGVGGLRLWSAASSSGQEALSLAMQLTEMGDRRGAPLNFSIVGTDISDRILTRARSFTYSQLEIQRGLSAPRMERFFTKDASGGWSAVKDIGRHITYQKLNLKEAFNFPRGFHVILCRNVLIYQSVEGKTEILKRISATMEPSGYLILGAGESLIGLSHDFEQEFVDGTVMYRKKAAAGRAA